MKVLICTFGRSASQIYGSLRTHTYDQLVLVMEKGTEESEGLQQVMKLEEYNPRKPETIFVDPGNFMDCYNKVENVIARYRKDDVILNISAGTKLLSMASILSAFNHGVPAFHYGEEGLVTLPVLRGVKIYEVLTEGQISVLLMIRPGMNWEKLRDELEDAEKTHKGAMKDYNRLVKLGLVELDVKKGKAKVVLTEMGTNFRDYFKERR